MTTRASTYGWVRGVSLTGLAALLALPGLAAAQGGAGDEISFGAVARSPRVAQSADEAQAADSVVPERPDAGALDPTPIDPDAIVPAGAGEKGDVDEVVVTGSRLQRDNYGGLGPISTLSADDFELKGAFSVGELLRDLPSIGLNGLQATDTNGGRGLETIDLRDLGAQRTLILVNGRRFVQSSTGASEAVDLNNLPPQLIQRVEVLRDGVSTIYGADAVAGVVNFILRDDFEGLQFDASAGTNQRGDGEAGEFSLLWGKNFSRGNLTLTGSVSGRRPIGLTDRRFSRRPIRTLEPNADGDIVATRDFFRARDGLVTSQDNPALNGTFFTPSGDRSFSSGFMGPRDGAKVTNQFFLTGESLRKSANGLFTFAISDAVELFAEGTYTRRDSEQRFSENFLSGSPTDKNIMGFTIPVFRSGDPRNNPFITGDFLDVAFTDRDGNRFGPDRESVNIAINRSLGEFGPRIFENKVETFRLAGGLRGELPALLGGFNWELFGNYGRNDDTERLQNDIDLTRALRSAQPALCAQDPKCVVGDFFGTNGLASTPGAIDYIRFNSRDRLRFHLKQVAGDLSGSLFDLPAGPLRAAFGAEYREEDGFATPDRRLVSGDTGGNARERTRGRQLIREAFFETQIPLLRGVIGFEELTAEISGRYTDYSSFGGRYLSRYAFSWAPVDMIRLRGVYATSFRSPGISDLFLGSADSFVAVRDRCEGFPNFAGLSERDAEQLRMACAPVLPTGRFTDDNPFAQRGGVGSQIRANVGGNGQLAEETADTINVGVVFSPPWIPELQVSLDYYDIDIQNPIVGQSAQQRIDDCLLRNSAVDCAALQRDEDGVLTFADIPRSNFGKIATNGFDFGIRYTFPLPVVGNVLMDFEGNYIYDFEVETPSGLEKVNGLIGIPNFKGRLVTAIRPVENWSLQATTRYIGGGEDETRKELRLPVNETEDVVYLDLSTLYTFGSEGKYGFTLGISNALDRDPPRVIDGFSNTALGTYDVFGRRFFAAFRARY